MRTIPRILKIIIAVALVHCLLTIFLSPLGWQFLYSWDSPHWLRAIWACLFSLPILIVFAYGWFSDWVVTFLLPPLNGLLLSWMVIMPVQRFLEFRHSRKGGDLAVAAVWFGFCLLLLGGVAAVWVPPNIVSAREACIHNLQQIDAAKKRWALEGRDPATKASGTTNNSLRTP
jgi:hypothetical protein